MRERIFTIFLCAICTIIFIFSFGANVNSTAARVTNLEPIYAGNTESSKVSLMINVYWGTEYIDDMLDVLDEYGVKTTFFVGGMWVKQYPDVLKNIYDHGHEIGNHGYWHDDQSNLDYNGNIEEITLCHDIVEETIGYSMNLFAPPSGAYNNSTLSACEDYGYRVIMWTRDTIDWRDKDENLTYSRAIRDIKGGDLVLMHPTAHTLSALPKVLKYIADNNLVCTTVSDTIG